MCENCQPIRRWDVSKHCQSGSFLTFPKKQPGIYSGCPLSVTRTTTVHSGFFPSIVKYFTETSCNSTKCDLVSRMEASSECAVSNSWTIKLLVGMLHSLTFQALLKEKTRLCVKGLYVPPSESFRPLWFFSVFFKSKGQSTICLVSSNSPTPTEVGPIQSETSTEHPALRAVVFALHRSTPVPLHCGNLQSHMGGWALSEMVQCYLGFVTILGNKDGIVLM